MCTALSFDLYCTNFKCPHNLFWEELNLGRERIQMTDKALEMLSPPKDGPAPHRNTDPLIGF